MGEVRKVGCLAVNMDLLEKVRQWVLCVAIVLLVAYVKPFPVVMAIGSFLGIVYVALNWRTLSWKAWWPLGLLIVFYIIAVINIRGELDPNMCHNTNWAELQLGFVLVPFMFIGLRPMRRWGSAWVLATVVILSLALVVAAVRSFQTVGGEVRFIPFSLSIYEREGFDAWKYFSLGYSFFSYAWLTGKVNAWPMYLSFACMVSLLVLLHRLYRERAKKVFRVLLCVYMLVGMFLCNARMMYIALVLCGAVLFFRMVVKRSYRPVPMYVVLVAVVGVVGMFLVGSRGGIFRVDSSAAGATTSSYLKKAFEGIVVRDPRVNLWFRTWQERDAFLPWGLGSGSAGVFIQKHYYEKYGDLYGNRYEDVVDRKDVVLVKMHNMLVDTAVEQGYLGVLYLLFLLLIPFTRLRHLKFIDILVYISLLVLISFESIVYSDFAISYFCMIYCAIITLSTSALPRIGQLSATDSQLQTRRCDR